MSAESRSHRVEGEVPSELEQVPVALDGDRMKASLEEMAIELVSMVEPRAYTPFRRWTPAERSASGVSTTR
jgi:hypothetical protein